MGQNRVCISLELLTDTEFLNDSTVTQYVFVCEVVQQTTTLTYELEEAEAAGVVFFVGFEVRCEVLNACCEERDLCLGRACVCFCFVEAVLLKDFLFLFGVEVVYLRHENEIVMCKT